MRIQTQLDEQRLKKLRYLAETTHTSASEILRQATDANFERISAARRSTATILLDSGFVGCGEASPKLSMTYKDKLNKSLGQKHGHR